MSRYRMPKRIPPAGGAGERDGRPCTKTWGPRKMTKRTQFPSSSTAISDCATYEWRSNHHFCAHPKIGLVSSKRSRYSSSRPFPWGRGVWGEGDSLRPNPAMLVQRNFSPNSEAANDKSLSIFRSLQPESVFMHGDTILPIPYEGGRPSLNQRPARRV